MEQTFDLIVIGAGPGGYVAAIKAAKLGLRTAIAEKGRVGGTCLNRGCIPAKAMIHASSLYQEMKQSEAFGVFATDVTFDYEKILSYKEETTDKLCQGVDQLLQANQVTCIHGKAMVAKEGIVYVEEEGTRTAYQAKKILLAAGSKPLLPPIEGLTLEGVLTSDGLFQLRHVPKSLLIIGGGVISVEFATVFQALGTEVTIVEAMPRLIPNMDKEISQNLKMILKKRGIDIHISASVQRIEKEEEGLKCIFLEKDKEISISAQYVLCAVGRCPDTDGLFEPGTQPVMERGRVIVDEQFQTNLPGVYAIGDLIFGMQLAHTASAQGICVAEYIVGESPTIDLSIVPSCVYTNPEIASVGLTEDEAKEKGISIRTGKFIMSANGKSLISKEERGFIKIVAEENSNVILGAQMMCARATDMIGEFATAIANGLTAEQMQKSMRAHPTYNEAAGEALEEITGEAIHVAPKRKKS